MKKLIILSILLSILFSSCTGRKRRSYNSYKPTSISQDYANGHYYSAFRQAAEILRKNKSEKERNIALSIIEESYVKSLEKERQKVEDKIKYLQDEKDYDRLKLEYNETKRTYSEALELQRTYKEFRSSLNLIEPLYYEGRQLIFPEMNFSSLVTKARDKYSDYLLRAAKSYVKGVTNTLSQDEKNGSRKAYDVYVMLQNHDDEYKKSEVINLKDEAFRKGQSYIAIQINNQLKQYKGIEQNILNGLKLGRWITIGKDDRGKYDYNFLVVIDNFDVSKGDVQRTVFDKEKEIVIQENQTDRDRRPVVVSRGRLLKSRLEIIDLFKEAFMRGTVKKTDNYTKKTKTDIIEASTAFQYSYAIQNGDIRAIDPEYLPLLEMAPMPLPTDGEMMSTGVTKFTGNLESKIISEAFHNN
ncbi:hypothetical protein [Flavobacterium bizetiae]|uniref:hypothetical protein n=1 Tax=Flavobacterium bizetiae TaxID=2704140 RepID=UPI0037580BF8